jgi:hypothetical protein
VNRSLSESESQAGREPGRKRDGHGIGFLLLDRDAGDRRLGQVGDDHAELVVDGTAGSDDASEENSVRTKLAADHPVRNRFRPGKRRHLFAQIVEGPSAIDLRPGIRIGRALGVSDRSLPCRFLVVRAPRGGADQDGSHHRAADDFEAPAGCALG